MLRIGFTIVAISILVGCTNNSPTETIRTPITIEPTIQQPATTTQPSSASPGAENTVLPENTQSRNILFQPARILTM